MSITDEYNFLEKIGTGTFSLVFKAENIKTKKVVAIKKIKIRQNNERQKVEITIMKSCVHPHIIKYYNFYSDDRYYYIVMEYINNGDLFEYITLNGGSIDEKTAALISGQVISALEYCHANLIAHRDLKLENIVIYNQNPLQIKLIDFGLANFIKTDKKHNSFVGSAYYAPPEIMKNIDYNPMLVDIWSLGICIFAMVAGVFPFQNYTINFDFNEWKQFKERLSDTLYDLLTKIFVLEYKRINILQLKEHPWLNGYTISSYLPETKHITEINCLIIEIMANLGLQEEKIFIDLYKNNKTMNTYLYHTLLNKYENALKENKEFLKSRKFKLTELGRIVTSSPELVSDRGTVSLDKIIKFIDC